MTTAQKYIIGAVAVAALFWANTARATTSATVATLSYLGQSGLPRGMRNNNPGNIRVSANAWKGKVPAGKNTDGAFEQFSTYAYGIRAMIKNLMSYYASGLNTLEGIIYKWAPPADNNPTPDYVAYVAKKTGFGPMQTLDLTNLNTMRKIVIAMAEVENGRPAITPDQFNYAASML